MCVPAASAYGLKSAEKIFEEQLGHVFCATCESLLLFIFAKCEFVHFNRGSNNNLMSTIEK